MKVAVSIVALMWTLVSAGTARAVSLQEAILLAKPAVALVTAEVRAEVTMSCGNRTVTVRPLPFVETGTGWFVDGRGYLVTNAHVVDPAHRVPPWVTHELKKKAIEQACVDPVLRAQKLMRGERPDLEEKIRREAGARALDTAQVTTQPQLSVLLSNGQSLKAEVVKFSPPPGFDINNKPVADFGRDLALLRVQEGIYPAVRLGEVDARIGDPIHIIGFPGVVLTHELLNKSATLEASVTNGAVSGYKQDAIGQDFIQTDAAAAHGNSGGPAVGDDARLVGVLTATTLSASSGTIVQGFNFVIPARDVRKFLDGTPVRPGESRFNVAWMAGLDALFAGRYSTALARLSEANAMQPGLTDVKNALAEAERKVKNPPPQPFPWAWVTAGVTLLSVGIYGAMFGRRWWKNRHRILPGQVIGAIENGRNPLLVDVRTRTDFETSPLRLPGAVRLEPEAVDAGRIDLAAEHDALIVAYDTSLAETTAEKVAQALRARGYRNVRILKGGLGGWTNARLPVESKSHLPSIGLELYKNLTLGDLERRKFKAGDLICREGDNAHGEAYVVHAGSVRIRRSFDGEEKTLNTLGEGELFGEIALFRDARRSADAVAATDVELLVIKNERLDWLIHNRPQLTREIVRKLSNMVVQTDRERALSNR
jgi:S1-C subfamily serine protease/rhodanese-related sulfurtransferase